ncbi:tyrosine-type recombinase/integrase [Actinoplanes sp. NPDC051851]|uniref:tyrosine-type recombinase/integrase n=1 Tax=Actinoplanes sp. NPDC051851 TaxID=3154753 RepID=UPI00343E3FCB
MVAGYPALPLDGPQSDVRRRTVSWLLAVRSANTAKAYGHDLGLFLRWCQQRQVDPLTARPRDLIGFRAWRELGGPGGRPVKDTTVARTLCSVSSWYAYLLVAGVSVIVGNPVASTPRPYVNSLVASSVGCTPMEVDLLLAEADAYAVECTRRWLDSPTAFWLHRRMAALRDRALLWLLAELGLRLGEALGRDVADVSTLEGRRVLRCPGRGGLLRDRPLPAGTVVALDDYLAARAAAARVDVGQLGGLLFTCFHPDGSRKALSQVDVLMTVRRVARKAGIATADTMSAHTLRHTFAATARAEGVALLDVQEAMGHADPRSTRRYMPSGYELNRDPALTLSARRDARRSAAVQREGAVPRAGDMR